MKFPPFKDGLRVVPVYDEKGVAWVIDAQHETGAERVTILPGDSWADALADLNERLEVPVTADRVRELMEDWAQAA